MLTASDQTHGSTMRKTAESDTEEELRVGSTTSPKQLASAISHAIYDNRTPHLRAIGASAVNQAVKAIAIARGYVAQRGLDLLCRPGFADAERREGDEGGDISCIVFYLEVE